MADLSSLFEVAPYAAAGFLGQNQQIDQDQNQMRTAELAQLIKSRQQEDQFKADLHPMDLQKALLANQTTDAALPGVRATSRKLGVDAEIAEGTKSNKIDEANTEAAVKMRQAVGQHLGSFASAIDENPNLPPHLALAQELENANLPPKMRAALMQRYSNVPASGLKAKLEADRDTAFADTPDMQKAGLETSAHMTQNRQTLESHERVAQIMAGGRVEAAGMRGGKTITLEQRLLNAKTPREKAEILEEGVSQAMAEGDTATAQMYLQRAIMARQRAAEDASNTGLAGRQTGINTPAVSGLPANAAPAATAPIATIPGATPAPDTGTSGNAGNVVEAAKQAWGAYEPNKYEYRFYGGKLQRKAK